MAFAVIEFQSSQACFIKNKGLTLAILCARMTFSWFWILLFNTFIYRNRAISMGGFVNPRIGSKIESVNHIKAIIVLGCTPTQNIKLVFKFNNFMTVPEMLEKNSFRNRVQAKFQQYRNELSIRKKVAVHEMFHQFRNFVLKWAGYFLVT